MAKDKKPEAGKGKSMKERLAAFSDLGKDIQGLGTQMAKEVQTPGKTADFLRQAADVIEEKAAALPQARQAAAPAKASETPAAVNQQADNAEEDGDENEQGAGGGVAMDSGDGKAKDDDKVALHLVADTKIMTYEEVMAEIEGMIGMDDFKSWIHAIDGGRNFDRVANLLNLADKTKKGNKVSYHITLLGNPGTGKSMAAELYAQYLKASGKMRDAMFYKVTAGDLVSPYVGATAKAIKDLLKQGKDKEVVDSVTGEKYKGQKLIIHLDEAYALTADSHGKQALNELVAVMTEEPERVVLILSGYDVPMGKMLSENPGMRSRVRKNVPCADYDNDDLLAILKTKLPKEEIEWIITPEVDAAIKTAFDKVREAMGRHFGNGRVAEYILMNARDIAKQRASDFLEHVSDEDVLKMSEAEQTELGNKMRTFATDDIEKATQLLLSQASDTEVETEMDLERESSAAGNVLGKMAQELDTLRNVVLLQQGYMERLLRGEDPLEAPARSLVFEEDAAEEKAGGTSQSFSEVAQQTHKAANDAGGTLELETDGKAKAGRKKAAPGPKGPS